MFRPVGSQPPAVYWRRRLFASALAVLVVVLVVLTVRTVFGGGGEPAAAGVPVGSTAPGSPGTPTAGAPTTSTAPAGGASRSGGRAATVAGTTTARTDGTSGAGSPNTVAPNTAAPNTVAPNTVAPNTAASKAGKTASDKSAPDAPAPTATATACAPSQLAIKAVAGRPDYKVGAEPVLTLQVTNTARTPCVQDVGDPKIVLRLYNGAARVWGSHDCKIVPGVVERTLEPERPAGFSVVWSGLTSQPHCAGTRQRVGAGTYTLIASLAGEKGKSTRFVIS